MNTMQSLRIDHDHQRQIIWLSGTLSNGYQFHVGFPIAHIQVTFDEHASSMGWCGEPLCGSVVSIDGFFGNIKALTARPGPSSRLVATAHNQTMQKVAQQALHYGKTGATLVQAQARPVMLGSRPSNCLPAVGAQGLAAMHAAHIVTGPRSSSKVKQQAARNLRSMLSNPTHPTARITIAALQSAVR